MRGGSHNVYIVLIIPITIQVDLAISVCLNTQFTTIKNAGGNANQSQQK